MSRSTLSLQEERGNRRNTAGTQLSLAFTSIRSAPSKTSSLQLNVISLTSNASFGRRRGAVVVVVKESHIMLNAVQNYIPPSGKREEGAKVNITLCWDNMFGSHMEMDVRWHSVGKKGCDSVCVCLKNDAFGEKKNISDGLAYTFSLSLGAAPQTLRTRDTGLMSSRTLIQAVANRRKRLSLPEISSHQFTIRENLSSRASHSIWSTIQEAKSDYGSPSLEPCPSLTPLWLRWCGFSFSLSDHLSCLSILRLSCCLPVMRESFIYFADQEHRGSDYGLKRRWYLEATGKSWCRLQETP